MDSTSSRGIRARLPRFARIPRLVLGAVVPAVLLVAGCSVVHVNGSMRTSEQTICVVDVFRQ